MPFYEYQCEHCGHTLEAMQKVSDAPLRKCPACGKSQLKRLMSAPVFRLKGSGWYETDFKSEKEDKRNLADRPEAAESGKDEKKEAAPAAAAGEDAKKPAEKPASGESAAKSPKEGGKTLVAAPSKKVDLARGASRGHANPKPGARAKPAPARRASTTAKRAGKSARRR